MLGFPPNGTICGDAGGDKGREALAVMKVCSLEPLIDPVVDIVSYELQALLRAQYTETGTKSASTPRPSHTVLELKFLVLEQDFV